MEKVNKFGYSFKEEFANTLTHGLGLLLSIIGSSIIITNVVINQLDLLHIISVIVFSLSLILMYCLSSLYHGLTDNRLKRLFQKLDHCSIYILIAGSYTPFTLISLYPNPGLFLFIFIWSLAVVGIIIENYPFKYSFPISMALYIIMGWFVLFFFQPLYSSLNFNGLILIVLGGLFYTFGIIFFVWKQIPYNHTIWHLFVLLGSICHYFAVLYCIGII